MEWEKIIANNATDEGLTSKIYQQLTQPNIKKKKKKRLKNGQKTYIDISLTKTYRWPTATGKDAQHC